MATITIALPDELAEKLRQRSERLQKRPEDLSREILEQALAAEPMAPPSVSDILERAGMLSKPSPRSLDVSGEAISLDEVRRTLSSSEGPTLSEILLEQRGPKG